MQYKFFFLKDLLSRLKSYIRFHKGVLLAHNNPLCKAFMKSSTCTARKLYGQNSTEQLYFSDLRFDAMLLMHIEMLHLSQEIKSYNNCSSIFEKKKTRLLG